MKVLITGASSGIGRDLAREFAKDGHEIVLVARNIERLEEIKKELIEKHNIKCDYLSVDLSSEEACKKLYEDVRDVDVLVNNAGFGDFGVFDETDLEKDLNMIKTNITALHILLKLYLKDMKEKNSGTILNVGSIAGFMPGPLMATYYATKNYVVRLSEAIRVELKKAKSNVQISVLCPGPVKTNFFNTANANFSIGGVTSEFVAKYTYKQLKKKKFYIVPSFVIRMGRFFASILPVGVVSNAVYALQKTKE